MRIDRYIFVEWLKVFILALFVLFGLLIISDLQDNLPDLLSFGASTQEIIWYYSVNFPSLVPTAMPMAFMVSLLFVLGQFHKNHEITAMRAAGLSLFRITRSLWLAGLVLTGTLFHLNTKLIPWSVEQSRVTWNELAFSKAIEEEIAEENVGLIYNLTFFNRKDGRLWFLNRFNEYNYRGYGITVTTKNPDTGLEINRLVANEGFYDDVNGGWTFTKGRETTFSVDTGEPIRSLAFEFKHMADYSEDPDLMKALEKRPKDLSVSELKTVVDYLKPAEDPRLAKYSVTFYDRLTSPVICLIILGLAIPFSVAGVRTNPFVGVSKAMGLFLLYYVLLNVAQLAGASGFSPLLASTIPNVAAFALMGFYYFRMQHP